jgi:hypothetical protein
MSYEIFVAFTVIKDFFCGLEERGNKTFIFDRVKNVMDLRFKSIFSHKQPAYQRAQQQTQSCTSIVTKLSLIKLLEEFNEQ